MFKINKKTIMLINTLTNYNILASNGKFTFQDFYIHEADKKKIYKLKNYSVFKENINEHFKDSNTLNFKQIKKYINKLQDCENIEIYDYKQGKDVPYKYIISIIKDPKEVFLQRKKCILNFFCESYELEDNFKNHIEIEFNETVNEETSIVDYIKDKYKVKSFSDDDFSLIDKETSMNVLKYKEKYHLLDGEYTIKLNKHVEGITKNKEDDDLIFNISLKVNDITNYKLKNITTIPQFKLKKGSTNKDLENYLKAKHGIETSWIKSICDDNNSSLSEGISPLKGGSYVLIFNDSVNNFVEKVKKVENTSNKNITLNIVPKDETKYKLNGILNSISVSVIENISYIDFVNEVKKTITDGKFEIYIDNNKVENGNIDINKQIVIKLLNNCSNLKEIKKDDDEDHKDDDNNNNTDKNNTQIKQKKYCGGKCEKK